MGPITMGLLITALVFILMYFLVSGVVRREMNNQMPTQLQDLRNKLKGDFKVMLEVRKDGETKI